MTFRGKLALITGAASGMGRIAAQKLAETGVNIAALDINLIGLQETAKNYKNIDIYEVDITNTNKINKIIECIIEKYGAIERVINAAAIMPYGKILNHETKNILNVMNINYGGLVNISKATLPHMIKNNGGDFIIFSSMLGQIPTLYTGAYSASKFATSAFAEILAHENQNKGIRFICVCPPAIQTPLLQQAHNTIWPKILDTRPPIQPEHVLESIEKHIEKNKFWVFPGQGTKIGWIMRRFFPNLVWKYIHKIENS